MCLLSDVHLLDKVSDLAASVYKIKIFGQIHLLIFDGAHAALGTNVLISFPSSGLADGGAKCLQQVDIVDRRKERLGQCDTLPGYALREPFLGFSGLTPIRASSSYAVPDRSNVYSNNDG